MTKTQGREFSVTNVSEIIRPLLSSVAYNLLLPIYTLFSMRIRDIILFLTDIRKNLHFLIVT